MDFGSWFNTRFKGEHIVLFDSFAKEYLNKNLTFAIELKGVGYEKQVLDIINKYSNLNHTAANVTSEEIKLANSKGIGVRLWGVSDEELMKKVYKLNIDGMTVNFPDKLKTLLDDDTRM